MRPHPRYYLLASYTLLSPCMTLLRIVPYMHKQDGREWGKRCEYTFFTRFFFLNNYISSLRRR